MIPVQLDTLVFIYLGLMLALVFGAWLVSEYRRQRRERLAFRHLVQCALCGFEYADETSTLLPRCPRCGSLNERYRVRRV